MAVILREPEDGWLIRMTDEVGKMATPGSLFRFGRKSLGGDDPVVEMYQPGWSTGARYFHPFQNEAEVRAFLLGLGFTEAPRITPGYDTPRWKLDSSRE